MCRWPLALGVEQHLHAVRETVHLPRLRMQQASVVSCAATYCMHFLGSPRHLAPSALTQQRLHSLMQAHLQGRAVPAILLGLQGVQRMSGRLCPSP